MTTDLVIAYRKVLVIVSRTLPRVATALNAPERRQRGRMLQHRRGRRLRLASGIVPDKQPLDEDVAIAARLLAAHRATVEHDPSPASEERPDQWTIHYEHQGSIVSLLRGDDPVALAAYLCNAARQAATVGYLQGEGEYERIRHDPAYRRWLELDTLDKLVSLAEAVGAIPLENPEAWSAASNLRRDPDELVERSERQLGLKLAPPDSDGGLFKLITTRGLFADRDLWGIFSAHLLRGVLGDREAPCVCEIGGGAGRVAYWSHRMGTTAYTLIDLPHASAIQGYYLLKNLPPGQVVLYGESGWERATDRVRVLPVQTAATTDGHRYDLVFNQDSFPEMHPSTVGDYLAWTHGVCGGGLLMSVNHESKAPYGRFRELRGKLMHVSLPEAVERVGGFERLQRIPYWLRRGYVAELYRVRGNALEDLHVGAVADDEAVGLGQGRSTADADVAADQAGLDAVLEVSDRGA
jgi:hypothetical protein